MCRAAFSGFTQLNTPPLEPDSEVLVKKTKLSPTQPGAKIQALLEIVRQLPHDEKTVVFSNFTSMLSLCGEALVCFF
jgi:SNF2 family DNA or RNA helicase